MKEIDLAYFPIVGRGEQINIVCALQGIKVKNLIFGIKDCHQRLYENKKITRFI